VVQRSLEKKSSLYDRSQGLWGMERKSGDSRSHPVEQETQLAFSTLSLLLSYWAQGLPD